MGHKEILLFSGGLDSYIAWHYLNKPPVLFFDAKHSYVQKELETVTHFANKHPDMQLEIDRTLDLSQWEKADFYIPYRNVLFTMVGSLYAPKVHLIGIKGDSVNDNNPEATKRMSEFYNHFDPESPITVSSPFYEMTKTQIVEWYIKQGLSIEDLIRTRSCYDKSVEGQCGKCGSCFRRWVAFENNGITENYVFPPWEWQAVDKYIEDMKKGRYDEARTTETLKALSKFRGI
ncbi:MAG: 7-cyano-7-deazaguanine synthase [Patescibacteria group bacterium]|nr:7-cyano-7-deazaguanine synthase [Patescibacteria group bacterium]